MKLLQTLGKALEDQKEKSGLNNALEKLKKEAGLGEKSESVVKQIEQRNGNYLIVKKRSYTVASLAKAMAGATSELSDVNGCYCIYDSQGNMKYKVVEGGVFSNSTLVDRDFIDLYDVWNNKRIGRVKENLFTVGVPFLEKEVKKCKVYLDDKQLCYLKKYKSFGDLCFDTLEGSGQIDGKKEEGIKLKYKRSIIAILHKTHERTVDGYSDCYVMEIKKPEYETVAVLLMMAYETIRTGSGKNNVLVIGGVALFAVAIALLILFSGVIKVGDDKLNNEIETSRAESVTNESVEELETLSEVANLNDELEKGEDDEDVLTNFIIGYEKAEFEKFNSPASENGLGDSRIYFYGTLEKTEILEAGESTIILGYVTDDSGNEWLIKLHVVPIVSETAFDAYVGKEIILRGVYSGFSGTKEMPAVVLDEMMILDTGETVWGMQKFLNDDLQNSNQIIALTESSIIEQLKLIDTIVAVEAVTETHDPNGKLNVEGGYISCVYFADKQVDKSELYIEEGKDNVIDIGNDGGGCIEVYRTAEEAEQRDMYLTSFDNTNLKVGSHCVVGTMVIRTSDYLSKEQQKELTDKIIDSFLEVIK